MTKNEWISNKIRILERENKGRSHEQNIAIAYSMAEREFKQEGGDVYNTMNEDYLKKIQSYLSNFSPVLQPMPISQTGGFTTGGYDLNNPYQSQPFQPIGYNPSIPTSLVEQPQTAAQQFTNNNPLPFKDPNQFQNGVGYTPSTTNLLGDPGQGQQDNTQYQDWVKYNILNPYNQGMDLTSSLTYTGQQFGQGNTGQGVMGAGLSLLKGARSFLSGYGSGKAQQNVENQLKDNLYNNDASLYTRTDTYQEGGNITNADLITGAFITEVPLQQPQNPEHMPYYNQLLDREIIGYTFNPTTQQYEVEYE
jgi:hypothetical protein